MEAKGNKVTMNQGRTAMMKEIEHFTDAPEIQHFAVEKVSKNDNVYGVTWGNVVREYLKTAYSGENAQAEVDLWNVTYKVLKRDSVTSFYDADGNTLFDVENTRLAKEYEYVKESMGIETKGECQIATQIGIDEKCEDAEKAAREEEPAEEEARETEECSEQVEDTKDAEESDAVSREAPLAGVETGKLPATTLDQIAATTVENAKPVKERAKEKLEREMKVAKDKTFADPIISYLLERCAEDEGLAHDVIQKHKTWQKCFDYIYGQARKQAKGNCAAVRDDVVFEWAEDYYHKDDKAEEEKKAKKLAERKAKQENEADERRTKQLEMPGKTKSAQQREETVKKTQKQKKSGRDMEGQLNIFSLMEM